MVPQNDARKSLSYVMVWMRDQRTGMRLDDLGGWGDVVEVEVNGLEMIRKEVLLSGGARIPVVSSCTKLPIFG